MFKKTVISALVLLALADPAGASAADGAIVFSEVTYHRPLGPGGEPILKPPTGGLFAFAHRHATQLTTDPADGEPALSADGRIIVFVREGDIWVMRADGSHPRQLTAGDDVDSHPLIAPNGRYVLFERRAFRKRGRDLYRSDLQAKVVTPLVATPAKEHEAAFSPDGRQIVYVRRVNGGRDDIWSVRPSGRGARPLTHTSRVGEFAPHYLGKRIAFSRGSKRRDPHSYGAIYSMDRRGGRVHRLVTRGHSVYLEDASATTRTILFARGRGLWVKRLGGPERKIASFPQRESTTGVFSPDGRHVAALNWELSGQSLSVLDAVTGHFTYRVTIALNLEGSESPSSLGRVVAWQPVPQGR